MYYWEKAVLFNIIADRGYKHHHLLKGPLIFLYKVRSSTWNTEFYVLRDALDILMTSNVCATLPV